MVAISAIQEVAFRLIKHTVMHTGMHPSMHTKQTLIAIEYIIIVTIGKSRGLDQFTRQPLIDVPIIGGAYNRNIDKRLARKLV